MGKTEPMSPEMAASSESCRVDATLRLATLCVASAVLSSVLDDFDATELLRLVLIEDSGFMSIILQSSNAISISKEEQ